MVISVREANTEARVTDEDDLCERPLRLDEESISVCRGAEVLC